MVKSRGFKKNKIIELRSLGNSAKVIADKLKTSESYVNKVLSINRLESAIKSSNFNPRDTGNHTNQDSDLGNKQKKARSRNIQLESIDPQTRKFFYKWVDAG